MDEFKKNIQDSFDKFIELSNNINEKTQRIIKELAKRQQINSKLTKSQMIRLGDSFQEYMKKLAADPAKLMDMQNNYLKEFAALIPKATAQWSENAESSEKTPLEIFAGQPWFNFANEYYSLHAKHAQNFVKSVEGLDSGTARQMSFYTKQFLDALSPDNFVATNPEIFRTTLETGGENLLKGLDNLIEDLERDETHFQIKMTDLEAFHVGKNIANTPGKVMYQNDLMQLIQYSPSTETVFRHPLLIIPPWINKYYILDLREENSFVHWLVDQGFTVFMISWINPDSRHKNKKFEDYMLEGPLAALEQIKRATGEPRVNAIGYCIGGTLLASTLAYLASENDHRVISGTYLATLLDFANPGEISAFVSEEQINSIEELMSEKGYLDGHVMSTIFSLLRAKDLIWSYYVKNYLLGEDPIPFDILYWNSDGTNLPASMHSFYLRNMYLHNRLREPDGIQLANVAIDLKKITTPVYFLSTQLDHIAPWQSTYQGIALHSGPVKFVLGGSGHVAGIINHPNKNKYGYYTNIAKHTDPAVWLSTAKKHEGTWWPHWVEWSKRYNSEQVPARHPGEGALTPLEDAPGAYVQIRLTDAPKKKKVEESA